MLTGTMPFKSRITGKAVPQKARLAPARFSAPATAPWIELLNEAIASDILPRLRDTHPEPADAALFTPAADAALFTPAEIAAFVELVIADDMERLRAIADRVIVQFGGRHALLDGLLTPVARRLGTMWEQDTADFMTVTLGVYRLDQLMKETATASEAAPFRPGFDYRILLVPAPGEQHSFGAGMVADAFREGGWCVRSGPAVSRAQLMRLVRNEWFDVIGLSVATQRWLKGLPACIRAVRAASCNRQSFIMVGGHAVLHHHERSRFLGADATAINAADALAQANIYVETTVTAGLHPSKTRLVDAG